MCGCVRPGRGGGGGKGGGKTLSFKNFLQATNFTLGLDATLNIEKKRANSVRIMASNSVDA